MGISTVKVQPILWDTVLCKVRFDTDGVHLDVEHISQPSVLSSRLAAAATKAKVLTKAALDRELAEKAAPRSSRELSSKDGRAGQKGNYSLTAVKRTEADLTASEMSSYVFWPQKIRISPKRITRFYFFTEEGDWTFDPPGFSVHQPTYDPAVGTFSTPQIIDYGRTVHTSFFPGGPIGGIVKYDLRLITTAWNNGVPDGHAIIIIDPVLETSKL